MYLSDLLQTSDPVIKRLLSKRSCLCCEVGQLNKELQLLKDVIRSKQKRLRKMNSEIIHQHKQGSHLSVVNNTGVSEHDVEKTCSQELSHHERFPFNKKLICLQGGQVD